MLNIQLINPRSITIIGGSNDIKKPGGKIVKNIIEGGFKGELCVVNPRENKVQGLKCYKSVTDILNTDLAILAIPSKYCLEVVKTLISQKNTKH